MTPEDALRAALSLIGSVPGFEIVSEDLRRGRILCRPELKDRGQATLGGTILIGPEAWAGEGDAMTVSFAATLVHEHWHTRQNVFLKTLSFWSGVWTRTHPMRRYEWPAYARQIAFLNKLAATVPRVSSDAEREKEAVAAAFEMTYGPFPTDVSP